MGICGNLWLLVEMNLSNCGCIVVNESRIHAKTRTVIKFSRLVNLSEDASDPSLEKLDLNCKTIISLTSTKLNGTRKS